MNGNLQQRKAPVRRSPLLLVLLTGMAAVTLASILAVQSVRQAGVTSGAATSGDGTTDRAGPGTGAAPGDAALARRITVPVESPVPSREAASAVAQEAPPPGSNASASPSKRSRATVRLHPQADETEAPAAGPEPETGEAPIPAEYIPDREGIRTALLDLAPQFRDCYRSWLDFDPEMEGKFRIRFVIEDAEDGSFGRVTSVNLADSELGNPLMEGCVMNLVAGLRFAPSDSGGRIVVSYPFVFRRS
jgi:hypothetical protein